MFPLIRLRSDWTRELDTQCDWLAIFHALKQYGRGSLWTLDSCTR